MKRKNIYGVYISYSHEDRNFVHPIVQLIRSMRPDLVFYDIENIKPGFLWESQLLDALDSCKLVVVFWCQHSAKSENVLREYKQGIYDKKNILPLLLDSTKLSEALAKYQYIDFRGKGHPEVLNGNSELYSYHGPFAFIFYLFISLLDKILPQRTKDRIRKKLNEKLNTYSPEKIAAKLIERIDKVAVTVAKDLVVIYNNSDSIKTIMLGPSSEMDTFEIKENDTWVSPQFTFNPVCKLKTGNHIVTYQLRLGNYYMFFWNDKEKFWDLKKMKRGNK